LRWFVGVKLKFPRRPGENKGFLGALLGACVWAPGAPNTAATDLNPVVMHSAN
jgi:hypothetical protein